MNAAIVLEPEGALRAMVAASKAWVRETVGDRVYLADPPHATLFAGTFDQVAALEPLLASLCAESQPISIRTTGMMVFSNDVRAGGGDTVILKADPTRPLFHLQRRVADTVKHLAQVDIREAEGMADPRWKASAMKYGWPFVGEHWVPHLTIATLDPRTDAEALRALMARPAIFESPVRAVSLWDVVNGHARPRKTFALGGARE